ncbi:MAG: zinc ABC transporter substrate-binding protein [Simkania negevensis]|nr:zinc ABC transporter substrate-binding protein [Simkania negevensis]
MKSVFFKAFPFLFLFFFLFASVSSCAKGGNGGKGSLNEWMEDHGKVKVLSTLAMIDDLVAQVGGEVIDHISLFVGEIDPHSYELVKGDDEKLARADLIFYLGLGLEHGASLRYYLENRKEAIALGEGVYQKEKEQFIFVEGQIDPHIWMDITLFTKVIDPIVLELSLKDPSHASLFRENGEKLKKRMFDTDRRLKEVMSKIPLERRYLVTSHDAFNYFTRHYLADEEHPEEWKKHFIAPEGLAPEGQMSSLDIQKVSDFLCNYQVSVIFPEANVSRDSLTKIVSVCRKRGLEVEIAKTHLFGDTMQGRSRNGEGGYLKMMEHNVKVLSYYFSNREEKSER